MKYERHAENNERWGNIKLVLPQKTTDLQRDYS